MNFVYSDGSTCSHNFELDACVRSRGYKCSNCGERLISFRDIQAEDSYEHYQEVRKRRLYSFCTTYGRIEF